MLINSQLHREDIVILIVEDNPDQQVLLREIAQSLGYHCHITGDADEGLQMANEIVPDVILLDLALPKKDGFEFLLELRSLENASDIPVVVISNRTDEADIIRAFSMGATEFLPKPVNQAVLIMKMGMLVSFSKLKNSYRRAASDLTAEKEKLERNLNFLNQYFPPDLIKAIETGRVVSELGGELVEATIMTLDIRNSTGIAEELGTHEFAETLNMIFADISDLIFANGGSINKMLGDGMVATFGAPSPGKLDAINAIKTAMKIEEHLATINTYLDEKLESALEMGIGIATGEVFSGNIGSPDRLEYTIIGSAVSDSSIIESLTKHTHQMVLIDKHTREKVKDVISLKPLSVNRGPIRQVYAINAGESFEEIDKKLDVQLA